MDTLQHDFFSKRKKGSTLEKHLPLFINLVSPNVVLEFPFTLVHSKLHWLCQVWIEYFDLFNAGEYSSNEKWEDTKGDALGCRINSWTFRGFNYMFLSMCDFSYSDYFKHLGSNWDSLYSFATPHICKTSDFSISDNANSCQTWKYHGSALWGQGN